MSALRREIRAVSLAAVRERYASVAGLHARCLRAATARVAIICAAYSRAGAIICRAVLYAMFDALMLLPLFTLYVAAATLLRYIHRHLAFCHYYAVHVDYLYVCFCLRHFFKMIFSSFAARL